jgi:hypothetical protein
MNAAFATTLISHEDFVGGLVVLRALTLENMINAIDAERLIVIVTKPFSIGDPLTAAFVASCMSAKWS